MAVFIDEITATVEPPAPQRADKQEEEGGAAAAVDARKICALLEKAHERKLRVKAD